MSIFNDEITWWPHLFQTKVIRKFHRKTKCQNDLLIFSSNLPYINTAFHCSFNIMSRLVQPSECMNRKSRNRKEELTSRIGTSLPPLSEKNNQIILEYVIYVADYPLQLIICMFLRKGDIKKCINETTKRCN